MLVDKKILGGGIVLLVIGIAIAAYTNSSIPAGHANMTEEEVIDLLTAEQEIKDSNTLSGILMAVGFLLILISFGARRKKDSAKKTEKKPAD